MGFHRNLMITVLMTGWLALIPAAVGGLFFWMTGPIGLSSWMFNLGAWFLRVVRILPF